ncbi:MAG TPA: TRAP transporter large permease subunit, partial [Casimicrobiaceae bacterium]
QTSFMHPPFGFALFYLRSVAPAKEYVDRITKRRMAPVTTGQIYWGAVPFVLIQILMVTLIIGFPNLVSGGLAKKAKIDTQNMQIEVPVEEGTPGGKGGSLDTEQEDAEKALAKELGGEKGPEKTPAP